MEGDAVDPAFDLTDDLAGRAVGILVFRQQKGQVVVPEIPLEPVVHAQLQDPVDAVEQKAFHVLCIVVVAVVIFHQECHILQDLLFIHMFVDDQFMYTHLSFLLSVVPKDLEAL